MLKISYGLKYHLKTPLKKCHLKIVPEKYHLKITHLYLFYNIFLKGFIYKSLK